MEYRINDKMNNKVFYLIALVASAVLFISLPTLFMFLGAFVADLNLSGGGFFQTFLVELTDLNVPMSDMTLGILALGQMIGEFLLAGIMVAFLLREFIKDYHKMKKNWLVNIGIIIAGIFLIYISMGFIGMLYQLLGIEGTSDNEDQVRGLLTGSGGVFMIIGTVILAPFVEEIIFRKLLYGVVENSLNLKPIFAIIISAVIFAAIHDVSIFFFQYFAMALVICSSYTISKNNIYVPISIHFLNNLLSVILFFLMPEAI